MQVEHLNQKQEGEGTASRGLEALPDAVVRGG